MILENLAEILPAPKFRIGDRVAYSYTCSDTLDKEFYGKEFTSLGMVLGIVLGWPDSGSNVIHGECWVYLVRIDTGNSPGSKTYPNWLESFAESELKKCS